MRRCLEVSPPGGGLAPLDRRRWPDRAHRPAVAQFQGSKKRRDGSII